MTFLAAGRFRITSFRSEVLVDKEPAAGLDTKSTAQNLEMTMADDLMPNFEIPSEMRQIAEKSLDEARKAFDGFIAAAQKAAMDMERQATAAQAGARDVGKKAIAFAEQNVTTSFEFAQKLARAKSAEEIRQLQTEFLKTQMQVLSDQAKELGEAATAAATDATKPTT